VKGALSTLAEEAEISTEAKRGSYGIGLASGRHKARVDSKLPIYVDPIHYVLGQSEKHSSKYVNLEGPLRNASRLLADKNLKANLEASVGPETLRILVRQAQDVAGMKDPARDMNTFWGRQKNRMTTGLMGVPNVFVPLKQPAAVTRYMTSGFVRASYLIEGMVESLSHPKRSEAMVSQSGLYSRRTVTGAQKQISDVLATAAPGVEFGGKTNLRKAMRLIGWTETRGSVRPGMQGAIFQVIDDLTALKTRGEAIPAKSIEQYKKSGMDISNVAAMTPDDIISAAVKYAEYATEQTQTSGNPMLQSDIQRGSVPEQLLTSFMAEGFTAMNLRRSMFLEAQRTGTPAAWRRATGVILGTLIAEPAYELLVNRTRRTVLGQDNPDIKKEAVYQFINSVFGGIPVMNQIAQSVAGKVVMGWNISNSSVTPLDNLANLSSDLVNRMLSRKSYTTAKGQKKLIEEAAGLFSIASGYALLPGVKLTEALLNQIEVK
jgi:hypothetical protein